MWTVKTSAITSFGPFHFGMYHLVFNRLLHPKKPNIRKHPYSDQWVGRTEESNRPGLSRVELVTSLSLAFLKKRGRTMVHPVSKLKPNARVYCDRVFCEGTFRWPCCASSQCHQRAPRPITSAPSRRALPSGPCIHQRRLFQAGHHGLPPCAV